MPFILRGVNLLGINSVYVGRDRRERVWQRLASDLKPRCMERIVTSEVALADLPSAFDGYMEGAVHGTRGGAHRRLSMATPPSPPSPAMRAHRRESRRRCPADQFDAPCRALCSRSTSSITTAITLL